MRRRVLPAPTPETRQTNESLTNFPTSAFFVGVFLLQLVVDFSIYNFEVISFLHYFHQPTVSIWNFELFYQHAIFAMVATLPLVAIQPPLPSNAATISIHRIIVNVSLLQRSRRLAFECKKKHNDK